jgi:hypothetical protein
LTDGDSQQARKKPRAADCPWLRVKWLSVNRQPNQAKAKELFVFFVCMFITQPPFIGLAECSTCFRGCQKCSLAQRIKEWLTGVRSSW